MKWTVTLSTLGLALTLAGCGLEPDATRTFARENVPFTFEVPAAFTDETVDDANSRGEVVAVAGLTKVDAIAVRRVTAPPPGPQRLEILGQAVTSEVFPVAQAKGWALECQYTDERADEVRSACRDALGSVRRR